jgi:hypothetical protein
MIKGEIVWIWGDGGFSHGINCGWKSIYKSIIIHGTVHRDGTYISIWGLRSRMGAYKDD